MRGRDTKPDDSKLGVPIWEAIRSQRRSTATPASDTYVEPPYVVCDQDKCVDPKTGDITPWQAIDIVSELNSWSYLSTSRTGLHTVVKGKKPGDKCRNGIELYSSRRFMALGSPLQEVPDKVAGTRFDQSV